MAAKAPDPMDRYSAPQRVCLLASICALHGCTGLIGGDEGPAVDAPSPGGATLAHDSTLRRLNAREYGYTVADLFGWPESPSVRLPVDDKSGAGFDNDGDSLRLGVDDAALYFEAASGIAADVAAERRLFGHCVDKAGAELWECIGPDLQPWLSRAFRAPVEDPTVGLLRALGSDDGSYPQAVETIVTFTLTSPHFLFHYKTVRVPDLEEIDDYERASRLSYLLWSSLPDDELFRAASEGRLSDLAELRGQAERMMDDARADRFFEEFPTMWLKLSGLGSRPDLDPELATSMRKETVRFVREAFRSDRPLNELLTAEYSYLDRVMAEHYGLAATIDEDGQRADLPDAERRGLLTQASVLSAVSAESFSDPIRRGVWVAEEVLCQPAPPPPPDVAELERDFQDLSPRKVLEQHRADPVCAGCHTLFDAYGLALETYDSLGRYRSEYEDGTPVDPSGELPTGERFADAPEMAAQLAAGDRFEHCLAEKVVGYALGRSLGPDEKATVTSLVAEILSQSGAVTLRSIIVRLIESRLLTRVGG